MSLEQDKIGGSGLTPLAIGFILGSSLLLYPDGGAGHDAWITVLLGMGGGLILVLVYAALSSWFPGKNLVEIADLVFGPYLGKAISAGFIWYLFHLGSMVLTNFGDYFSTMIFIRTPRVALLLLIVLACASAAGKGIEVITRCSQVLVPLTVVVILTDTSMLINRIDLRNLLPVLEVPLPKLLAASFGAFSFPFAEAVAFLMVLPALNRPQQARPALLKAILAGGLLLALIGVRNIGVTGVSAGNTIYPSYEVVKLIKIGETNARFESLIAINILAMGFLKIAVCYYGAALGTASLFHLKGYRQLLLPIGALMIIAGLINTESIMQLKVFAEKMYPLYAAVFQLAIPLATLAVACLRHLPGKGGRRRAARPKRRGGRRG